MKLIIKMVILLALTIALVSCDGITSMPRPAPTVVMETAMAMAKTTYAEMQAATPTLTLVPITATSIPFTRAPLPTLLPYSGTPTAVVLENGLTWTECVAPNSDPDSREDLDLLAKCIPLPNWNSHDKNIVGRSMLAKDGFTDSWIKIGDDVYKTEHDSSHGCCNYKLIKNGRVIYEINPGFYASSPNRGLWNIEGKLVWELTGWPRVIVVDLVNYNEKYQLEGSFYPYEIKGKLIFIALKNEKYHIVYDGEFIGTAFDKIFIAYCCDTISVRHGGGQFWFYGIRKGNRFVVSIQ